jgi:DNA-binding response OmpR family regulator
MQNTQYNNIKVLVAEPTAKLRREITETLLKFGFRDIVDTGNLGVVVKAIEEGEVDLLIGDTKMPEGDLSEMVYDVRHGDMGENPFLITIILVSDATKEILQKVIDSGTDAVLIKPFSQEDLLERINTLARRRKRFVVTADYVGPDRRGKNRKVDDEIMLISVPNPLRDKSLRDNDQLRDKKSVELAVKSVNEQKIERYAVQINWLIEKITPDFVPLGDGVTIGLDQEGLNFLMKLSAVSHDFNVRLKSTHHLNLSEMAMTMKNMSNAMITNTDAIPTEDLIMMSKLGKIIETTVSRGKLLKTENEQATGEEEAGIPESAVK